MDEIDRKLLEFLQQDVTMSVAQIADRVGLSATPCWKRIQKMEAAGVIVRRVALVSPERVGMSLTVFVAVEAVDYSPAWLQAFSDFVTPIATVMEVYRMAKG